jgi:hypothetical protein
MNEWLRDKHPLLGLFALIVASSAEECIEMFETAREERGIERNTKLPKLKKWLSMYNTPEKVRRGLFSSLKAVDKDVGEFIEFYEDIIKGLKEIKKIKPEELKRFWIEFEKENPGGTQEVIKEINEKIKGDQDFVMDDVVSATCGKKKELNKGSRKNKGSLKNKPEIIFFMRTFFPCFIRYGKYVNDLMKEAQYGEEDALDKLITLDRSVIFDTKISEMIHQAGVGTKLKVSMIIKALNGSQEAKKKGHKEEKSGRQNLRKNIKYSLGGLISLMSMEMKQKIEAKEIYNLFDCIALDKNGNIDPDLKGVHPDSFARQIERHRTFWHNVIPLADK